MPSPHRLECQTMFAIVVGRTHGNAAKKNPPEEENAMTEPPVPAEVCERVRRDGKFHGHAVTDQFDQTCDIFGDERVEDLTASILEGRQGSSLVFAHHRSVADHIGGQHRGKATFVFLGLGIAGYRATVKRHSRVR